VNRRRLKRLKHNFFQWNEPFFYPSGTGHYQGYEEHAATRRATIWAFYPVPKYDTQYMIMISN
jgi:hypothetical protein